MRKSRNAFKSNSALQLAEQLTQAEGYSRSVIVVLVDIRGFSSFSKNADSVEVGWFIKKAYSWILTKHFPFADFCKPTGDGLLIIIDYSESNLKSISATITKAAIAATMQFPEAFKDDLVITFPVPPYIAISITRGTACEIRTPSQTIDYCGKIINLASRLLAVCRPKGVILEGSFRPLIEPSILTTFADNEVFLPGIAESKPIRVLTSGQVVLPPSCLNPIGEVTWATTVFEKDTLKNVLAKGNFHYDLPKDYKEHTACELRIGFPSREKGRIQQGIEGFTETSIVPKLTAGEWKLAVNYPVTLDPIAEVQGIKSNDMISVVLKYQKNYTKTSKGAKP